MLEQLKAAVEALDSLDVDSMGDRELGSLLVELRRLENELDARATRLTGAWDARKAWSCDRARSGASWLAFHAHMPRPTASRRMKLARAVRDMPLVESTWSEGLIESFHVSMLERVHTPRTTEAFNRDEGLLVEKATSFRFDDFCRVVGYWYQQADPDGAEVDASEQHAQRRAHLSQTFGGMWVGDLLLDPIGGTIIRTALQAIEQELFEADWADARSRVGEQVTLFDLARTPAQRRADAWVGMAERARRAPVDGRRPAPLFTVLVGYETFVGRVCELANGTAITPGALVPWLTEADIERVVFAGPSRVIDVGATRRLFEGATRRAVEVRDRLRCFVPECTATDGLEIDHIEPWSAGGRTVQVNGRVACGAHNRSRHQRAGPDPP